MPAIEITVNHPQGLHARPASKFVQTAGAYPCAIQVTNLSAAARPVNAKSILKVLALGVTAGCSIRVEAEGQGSDEALAAIKRLVDDNFAEQTLAAAR